MVARMAQEVLDLNAEIADTDAMIEDRFLQHRHATIIVSMPGFGPLLAAEPELLAATNGSLASFDNPDRLAGIAGLAPVPRATQDASAATSSDLAATIAAYCGSSTWLPTTASEPALNRETTTTANEPKANATPKRSYPSLAGASTSSGPCNATTPPTSPSCLVPLDNPMRITETFLPE